MTMTASQRKNELSTFLSSGANEIARALPVHMSVDRMIRVALTAVTMQPKLLECSKASLALALMNASALGLEPDGYHGHLVPYKDKCQFIPDYKGLIQLALKNGVFIDAHAVYEKDIFEYQYGLEQKLTHVPSEEADRGKLRCAYAVATFSDGRKCFVVSNRSAVMKRRDASPASKSKASPWTQWEESMWVKTAVKMLSKFVPISPHLTIAVQMDNMADMGVGQQAANALIEEVTGSLESREEDAEAVKSGNSPKAASRSEVAKQRARGKRQAKADVESVSSDYDPSIFKGRVKVATTEQEVRDIFADEVASRGTGITSDEFNEAGDFAQKRIDAINKQ